MKHCTAKQLLGPQPTLILRIIVFHVSQASQSKENIIILGSVNQKTKALTMLLTLYYSLFKNTLMFWGLPWSLKCHILLATMDL